MTTNSRYNRHNLCLMTYEHYNAIYYEMAYGASPAGLSYVPKPAQK